VRGKTGYSRSNRTFNASRLVARMANSGHAASKAAISPAASITCSQLSSTSSSRFGARKATRVSRSSLAAVSRTRRIEAIAGETRAGSVKGARSTKKTPSGNAASNSAATANASRVLPDPPGPVSVTSRDPSLTNRRLTAAASSSRPMSGVGGTVRFVG
jgi:hypothetical protein